MGLSTSDLLGSQAARDWPPKTSLPSLTGGHEGNCKGGSSQEKLRRGDRQLLFPLLGTQARMAEEGGIIDREWRTVKRLNSIAWILEE